MPVVGLGTWKMAPDVVAKAIVDAVDAGFRHIDCAWIYQNEKGVGDGIAEVIKQNRVAREDLWVTSKLWNDCHRPEHVEPALRTTLDDLGLDELDLYLIHWPVAHQHGVARPESGSQFLSLDEVPLIETWQALEACQKKGLCKHIGVSNFNEKKLKDLIGQARVKPVVNQVESHPLLQQNSLKSFCDEQGIVMTAYSPLGSGDRPEGMKRDAEPSLFANPVIQEVGAQLGLKPAEILLAWAVCRGTAAIPKSVTPEYLRQNVAAASIELPDTVMETISQLDKHYRFIDGTFWEQPGGPYTVANLWDE